MPMCQSASHNYFLAVYFTTLSVLRTLIDERTEIGRKRSWLNRGIISEFSWWKSGLPPTNCSEDNPLARPGVSRIKALRVTALLILFLNGSPFNMSVLPH